MPYFVEYIDGRIEKCEGELNPEALGLDVLAGYTVAQVYTKQSVFKAENLVPKIVRRIRMADGTMKLKEEMTAEELKWYSEKRKREMAGRKKSA